MVLAAGATASCPRPGHVIWTAAVSAHGAASQFPSPATQIAQDCPDCGTGRLSPGNCLHPSNQTSASFWPPEGEPLTHGADSDNTKLFSNPSESFGDRRKWKDEWRAVFPRSDLLRAFLHNALNYHVPRRCPFCRGRWVIIGLIYRTLTGARHYNKCVTYA